MIERVFERRIREKVKIDAMLFGLMLGKGTADAILTVRQMQEKYGCKGKKLYFAFVDLEKAFDRVPEKLQACIQLVIPLQVVGEGCT